MRTPRPLITTDITMEAQNPFYVASDLPLGMPRFDLIRDEHFGPAYERGMAEHREEIRQIADGSEAPSFENTIVGLERSGRLLTRVKEVFDNLTAAHTNDRLEALRSELAPKLAAHRDAIVLDPALFERIDAVHHEREALGLDDESLRLVERYHRDFVRAGALLSDLDKERLKHINAELAELATTFSQNVLNEVNATAVVVDAPEELAGLSGAAVSVAARAAESRGFRGKYLIPLQNTTGQPVLAHLEDRAIRQRIYEASRTRGSRGGDFDNREVASRMLRLRAERARMLGYDSHAAYVLADETARSVEAVNRRLSELTPPAIANAHEEAAALQALIDSEGAGFGLEPWDWTYYTEKVRRAEYDFDEAELRPYLELNTVLEKGVFYAAERLFGLTFHERHDLPTYHPTVRVFEVHEADGELLAIFLADFYARPSKRGGAWESTYVSQSRLLDERVVVANHLNVPEPKEGDPTLLTFDEVITLFHEFGHALHAMLSDVTYPRFSGTSVPRDFVEFPSQANEMWAIWPEIVDSYAVHHETGAPMPRDLVDKVLALKSFNQGFKTSEYLKAALVDQALHQLGPEDVPDAESILTFEADALNAAGAAFHPVPPRYRIPYFSHIFSSYSAAYYSYIWAEVLDADAVVWFRESGGLTRDNGEHYRRTILSMGGSRDEMALYRDFRGRDASVEPLLERRGLVAR